MMKEWVCARCGQEVLSKDRPEPIRWTDGHRCCFVEVKRDHYIASDSPEAMVVEEWEKY